MVRSETGACVDFGALGHCRIERIIPRLTLPLVSTRKPSLTLTTDSAMEVSVIAKSRSSARRRMEMSASFSEKKMVACCLRMASAVPSSPTSDAIMSRPRYRMLGSRMLMNLESSATALARRARSDASPCFTSSAIASNSTQCSALLRFTDFVTSVLESTWPTTSFRRTRRASVGGMGNTCSSLRMRTCSHGHAVPWYM